MFSYRILYLRITNCKTKQIKCNIQMTLNGFQRFVLFLKMFTV